MIEIHKYRRRNNTDLLCADCLQIKNHPFHSEGYTAIDQKELQITTETIAEEASRIVYGDREQAYDSPNRNFKKIAHMWTGTILEKLKDGEHITPNDVALMLAQLKISRESFQPNRENRVDGIGYWLCLERIVQEQTDHDAK